MYGGIYTVFDRTEVDNISVTFINADSFIFLIQIIADNQEKIEEIYLRKQMII